MRVDAPYSENARAFLKAAREDLTKAREMERALRQAEAAFRQVAEKGWGAAREGVKALLQKKGLKPPRGTRTLSRLLWDLQEGDPGIQEMRIYERFTRFLHDLHVDAFEEGTFSVKRIERDLRDLEAFLVDLERL